MKRNEIELSEINAELIGISYEISAISTLFDENIRKLTARPTNRTIQETLFAVSRHIERCAESLSDIEEDMLRRENEAHGN